MAPPSTCRSIHFSPNEVCHLFYPYKAEKVIKARSEWKNPNARLPSLIPSALKGLEEDLEYQATLAEVKSKGQQKMTTEERKRRRRALQMHGIPRFSEKLSAVTGNSGLTRGTICTVQVNVGLYCNQACSHCHVEASPLRRDAMMTQEDADRLLHLLRAPTSTIKTLDITGGAPEMNPVFFPLAREARKLGIEVIDRCNLTVLLEPDQIGLADFLADNTIRIVASLPCYTAETVDKQRGASVYERSIAGLKLLNSKGYGTSESLVLDLVYNPSGAFLPPDQESLQAKYKEALERDHGIRFNKLFCFTNMPIKRFADFLLREKQMGDYMKLLSETFNADALEAVMCRSLVSVKWDGDIYDCDFNLALDIAAPSPSEKSQRPNIRNISSFNEFANQPIAIGSHCYGCTAGKGSS